VALGNVRPRTKRTDNLRTTMDGVPLMHLRVVVSLTVIRGVAATIVLQTLGLAPAMRIAN